MKVMTKCLVCPDVLAPKLATRDTFPEEHFSEISNWGILGLEDQVQEFASLITSAIVCLPPVALITKLLPAVNEL